MANTKPISPSPTNMWWLKDSYELNKPAWLKVAENLFVSTTQAQAVNSQQASKYARNSFDHEIMKQIMASMPAQNTFVSSDVLILPTAVYVPPEILATRVEALSDIVLKQSQEIQDLKDALEAQQILTQEFVEQNKRLVTEFEGIQYMVDELSDEEIKQRLTKPDVPKILKTLLLEELKNRLRRSGEL